MKLAFSRTLLLGLFPGLLASASLRAASPPAPERDLSKLTILGPNYPRAFFFRSSEAGARKAGASYEEWDAEFSQLMGIMGKCLDEEVLKNEVHNPEFFTRFKQNHLEQVVLLHFNGNARDPLYQTEKYFPGHWIYRKAVRILADVPAQSGETVLRVEDAKHFRVNAGRYRTANDDIGLFGLAPDGKHDWGNCEQVQLLAVDAKAGTIKVKRGCYGTKPLAFKAGQARAAAHEVEGPWGKENHLLWFYNFSALCPKDAEGKNCADRLVDDLAAWFGPGGKLAAFDGLEFDVMYNDTKGDTDGDGEIDNGVIQGINQYGIGMVEFARKLRARLGDNRIIQGDGALGKGGVHSQRTWHLLNGIESEGFPNLDDWNFEDWSGGLNRHYFWQANARPPAFNYINHKWEEPVPGKPGEQRNASVPMSRHRLAFAAAQFTDAMVCYSFSPPAEKPSMPGIWDELCCGQDHKLGWLGRPEGPAVHLAAQTPDLLADKPLAASLRGDILVREQAGELIVSPKDTASTHLNFTLPAVATRGEDLLIQATMKGEPRKGYPHEMARFTQLEVSGGQLSLVSKEPEIIGLCLRSKAEQPFDASTGAHLQRKAHEKIGDRTLDGYAIHPPYLKAPGYVFWCKDVEVPADTELRFSLGMGEKSPARSDGVWFQVWVAELQAGKPGKFTQIFEKSTKAYAWIPCSVPLGQWAGKRVRLKFVADCGPHDNTTTDQGFWGDVKIVKAGEPESANTAAKSCMTWLNDRAFTATFYFRDIKSVKVNLAFDVEGAEPVTIQKLSAFAHADAMYRVFENGLVLANPGHHPYTFDLSDLTPGRTYRRLKGSQSQDREANNGQLVSGKVTLGERDALFLLRVR